MAFVVEQNDPGVFVVVWHMSIVVKTKATAKAEVPSVEMKIDHQ